MLMRSRRHTAADLAHWERMERMDVLLATSTKLAKKEAQALEVLRAFLEAGPAYVGVSWGKDSVVVAHLAWRLAQDGGPRAPLAWFPAGVLENPDNALVRDVFMAGWPGLELREVDAGPTRMNGDEAHGHDGAQAEFEQVSRAMGERYVSGVRAEESGTRALAMRHHGLASRNTCRPIGWWSGLDVFAYLHKHGLPVHPAYACTEGGLHDRCTLRVSTIGGERGRRFGRREWEQRYYRDHLRLVESQREAGAEAWNGR